MRRKLLAIILILFFGGFYFFRYLNAPATKKGYVIQGKTFGSISYTIKFLSEEKKDLQTEVDKILNDINTTFSTYIPNSEISQFNQLDTTNRWLYQSSHFLPVLQYSKEVFENTNGAFDPTILPLVKAWGFTPNNKGEIDTVKLSSLQKAVGFEKLYFDSEGVKKSLNNIQLDFGAIAKGYGVDVVADYFKSIGIYDFMVEIGGEVACSGLKMNGKPWVIGVDHPVVENSEASKMILSLKLNNRSLATSGNYRNFFIKDGKRYVHTIDPRIGKPAYSDLLSASVLAENCTVADAYATAFMVLGFDESIAVLKKQKHLSAILIYEGSDGKLKISATPELEHVIQLVYSDISIEWIER